MDAKVMQMLNSGDKKWTTKDKLNQYKGLIHLQLRDKKQQSYEARQKRHNYNQQIRELRKDVEYYRNALNNALVGDKHELINTLKKNPRLCLALERYEPEKVSEEMVQVNYTKIKKLDLLNYEKKKRMDKLHELRLELLSLQERIEVEKNDIHPRRMEQVITIQIQNALIRQNAAGTINRTYVNILEILKKDALYFDVVLNTLQGDHYSQCKCIIHAAEMGQRVTEHLATLQHEYKRLERQVRTNMKERDRAVRMMRREVEALHTDCKMLIRTESVDALDKKSGWWPTPRELLLPKELEELEQILHQIQEATLVSSYEDIFPRMEMQLKHKNQLIQQLKENTAERDALLNRKSHAELTLATMQQAMEEHIFEYHESKNLLNKEIEARKAEIESDKKKIVENGHILVNLRCSLQTLYEVLDCVNTGEDDEEEQVVLEEVTSDPDLLEPVIKEISHDAIPVIEEDPLVLLEMVTEKMRILIEKLPHDPPSEFAELARETYQQNIANMLGQAEFDDKEAYEFYLGDEMDAEDLSVPTRRDIKMRSEKICEEFGDKNIEHQLIERVGGKGSSSSSSSLSCPSDDSDSCPTVSPAAVGKISSSSSSDDRSTSCHFFV
ncbi:unnamed protein product, partial [Timema podura]|nr:unnamed protein product [Timema podura]